MVASCLIKRKTERIVWLKHSGKEISRDKKLLNEEKG